jgi:hypothetical protein
MEKDQTTGQPVPARKTDQAVAHSVMTVTTPGPAGQITTVTIIRIQPNPPDPAV